MQIQCEKLLTLKKLSPTLRQDQNQNQDQILKIKQTI